MALIVPIHVNVSTLLWQDSSARCNFGLSAWFILVSLNGERSSHPQSLVLTGVASGNSAIISSTTNLRSALGLF